jgi:gliding motility-associated-like protein
MIRWSDGSDSVMLRVDSSGVYAVEVLTGCGVRGDSISIQFELCSSIEFPNAFTPNDDQVNDVFRPIARDVTILSFSIFNRWGGRVYQSGDNNAAWNGLHNGEPAPSDVYVWMCEYIDLKSGTRMTEKGDVVLLR